MSGLGYAVGDTLVLAERSVKRIARQPDLWTAFTIQPIMFVLLFAYVFGGAINVPPQFGDYKDFLMPGIIVQAMSFGGFVTALMIAVGLLVGFSFGSPALEVIGGVALLFLIGYAFSWVFAFIGLNVSSPEAA